MKKAILLALAAVTSFSMNAFAVQERQPLYCTSDDLSLVVEGDPGAKSMTLSYGGRINSFSPDAEVEVKVVSKVFNRLKPQDRVFSMIGGAFLISDSPYYLMVISSGPIQLKVTGLGVRATFKATVTGSIPQDQEGRSFSSVPVECELRPVMFK